MDKKFIQLGVFVLCWLGCLATAICYADSDELFHDGPVAFKINKPIAAKANQKDVDFFGGVPNTPAPLYDTNCGVTFPGGDQTKERVLAPGTYEIKSISNLLIYPDWNAFVAELKGTPIPTGIYCRHCINRPNLIISEGYFKARMGDYVDIVEKPVTVTFERGYGKYKWTCSVACTPPQYFSFSRGFDRQFYSYSVASGNYAVETLDKAKAGCWLGRAFNAVRDTESSGKVPIPATINDSCVRED